MNTEHEAKPSLKQATVMFLDVKGFTALSEEVGPEAAYFAVAGCMSLVEGVARAHGGAVDRYLGDCMMVVFGHPVRLAEPERAALTAALEMRRLVEDYDRELDSDVSLKVAIGINTGPMVAGTVRGNVVREFHVLGDAVNVSARIKARAPLGQILVGDSTREVAAADYDFEPLGAIPLKGKSMPVPIFELKGSRERRWRWVRGVRDPVEIAFLGRGEERAWLGACFNDLAGGRGGALALVGDAGIGKSRLFEEVASQHSEIPVLEIRAMSAAGSERRLIFRDLAAALELPEQTPIEECLAGLERHAGGEPMILAIEDAGRLDAEFVAWLPRLVELAGRVPILVVVLVRTPCSGPIESVLDAASDPSLDVRRLEPLGPADSQTLVESVARNSNIDVESVPLIQARAAGNPRQLILATHLEPALRTEQVRGRQSGEGETERRRATILFADISGFTAMTEKLGAERAYPIVAGCLQLLDEIATRHGGTVEKYLGDCVMALFGVTEAMEDAPRAAINAAIEMRRRVREYNKGIDAPMDLDVHSGINVGLSIAGEVENSLLGEFTVMGDPVDVADALTDMAPSGRIFVGGEVQRFTRDVFDFEAREPLEVKGTGERVPVFEVTTQREHLYRSSVGSERQVYSALVGRENELTLLKRGLSELCAGRGGVVNIIAEAGLGKSRLITEVEDSPAAEGTRWLLGRSLSTGRRLGFHPFSDLLRSFAAIDDENDDAAIRVRLLDAMQRWMGEEAIEAFPYVGRVLGVPLETADQERLDAMPGDAMEQRIRRDLTALLRAGSGVEPLVVVMDDLHWADQSSLELLMELLGECRERAILFVNLFRPGSLDSSERLRAFAAETLPAHTCEIALKPLEPRAARDLLANLFGPGDLPHVTRLLIEEKASGNPFYIEEVVRALVDAGAVETHAGRFRATDRIDTVEIPGSIQEVVQARVDGLERGRRRLLQMAAVVGQTFHLDVVSEVASGGGTDATHEILEQLLAAEFLVPSDRLPGEEYAFKHPLIQEVTYAGLLEARREELHRRVGEAVEAHLSEDIPGFQGMLAYHFSKGRDLARAEEYLLLAGEDAARAAASNEALHFFEEAAALFLEIHGETGDPEKRAILEANIASALYHRGRFVDSISHYDAALELLGDKVASSVHAQRLQFAWDLAQILGRLYLPIRLRRARVPSDRERRVMALRYARVESTTYASPERHVFDAMRTLAMLQRLDARQIPEGAKLYGGGVAIFAFAGVSFDASRRLATVAHELAAGAGPPERLYEQAMRFVYRVLEGDWSAEHEIDPALVSETVELGHLYAPVTYLGLLAEKRVHQGDFAGLDQVRSQIEEIWEVYRYDLAKTNLLWLRAIVPLAHGRLEEARRGAIEYYEENPEDLLHLLGLGLRAQIEILLGELDDAEETLAEAAGIEARSKPVPPFHASRYLGARLLLDIERLKAAEGDQSAARRSARRRIKAVIANTGKMAFGRVEMLALAGRFEWLEGRYKRSLAHFEQSISAAEELGAIPARAQIFGELADLLAEAGPGPDRFRDLDEEACRVEALSGIQDPDVDPPTGGSSTDATAMRVRETQLES